MMKYTKNIVLIVLLFISTETLAQHEFLFFKEESLLKLKEDFQSNSDKFKTYIDQLKYFTEKLKGEGPWSVTFASPKFVEIGSHDYVSESPYWWPDPENPNGPYIRKDGERNPDRFNEHKEMIMHMYQKATLFSIAAFLFDSKEYAQIAEEVLNVWFVNEETRMNPHLKYAQIIKGHTRKRGVGIIETHRFISLVEAMNLLRLTGYWSDESYLGLRGWFAEFNNWLKESEYGIDEKERGNNHSSWYAAQIAANSVFIGEEGNLEELVQYVKNFLVENQIKEGGSMPLEEARTLSLSYSTFNLNALSSFASIADNYGYNIWTYKSDDSGSITDAVNRVIYFIDNPSEWQYKQIREFKDKSPLFMALYGLAQEDIQVIKRYKQFMPGIEKGEIPRATDPFDLLVNLYIVNYLSEK